ncbi:hypothetical protein [Caldimonas tepidiphila]|uniref:hypothetical protein n=1 Tax=Caldimonas tepidiphila TaxID=2315841 RepID=UPI000E5A8C22|nr:hypothetical protein [Caldimonas tepidiphila]
MPAAPHPTPSLPVPHQRGPFEVLPAQHEVSWPDGSALLLHPVRQRGDDDGSQSRFLQALELPGSLVVFDVRDLARPLESADTTARRDGPQPLLQKLQRRFLCAKEAVEQMCLKRRACWLTEDSEPA